MKAGAPRSPCSRAARGYEATLPPAAASFTYRVTAGTFASDDYAVTVVHAPRVERIDVAYAYPAHTGLDSRLETGGGDVFAPEGTEVTVTVHADKPISDGSLHLVTGGAITLRRGAPAALSASFEVTRDDTYRRRVTRCRRSDEPVLISNMSSARWPMTLRPSRFAGPVETARSRRSRRW